jgi:hypothetical protein
MAKVAQSHGIRVEVARFETWDPGQRMFDLVVCGQAWHWVDPSVGPRKAAAILPPSARLAIFWNRGRHDARTKAALDELYSRFAPSIAKESVPPANQPPDDAAAVAAIAATRLFAPTQLRSYGWTQQYSRDEWLDQLGTHSDHIALRPEQRATLLDAVGAAIDKMGGSITVHYETRLVSAQRTD